MVGLTGFEPATSRSRTERSTKLSHNPLCFTLSDRINRQTFAALCYHYNLQVVEKPRQPFA